MATLAVALGLLGRAGVEQLLLGGAGDNVQEQPLAGAQHQGLTWYGALEQLHLVWRQVKSPGGNPQRASVHGEQHMGRTVVDDSQAVRRVEAISWLLRCDSQAKPVLRPFARDGFEEDTTLGAAQRQPQLVDDQQARFLCTLDVMPAHL